MFVLELSLLSEIPERNSLKTKGLFWLMLSEISVFGCLGPSLWACDDTEHHNREGIQFTETGKQRERERERQEEREREREETERDRARVVCPSRTHPQ
jgi:hypothetical protein